MGFIEFLTDNKRWLSGSLLLMFASSPGQTLIIAQYSAEIRETFTLTHGAYGSLYSLATVASAAILIWAGKSVDHFSPATVGVASIFMLACFVLLVAYAPNIWVLGIAFCGLRLFGHGMLPQTAITAIGRWFHERRGKAVAIATLGILLGEALLPLVIVSSMALFGWRETWVLTSLILVFAMVPICWGLLRVDRTPKGGGSTKARSSAKVPDWTRSQVLRDWRFWIVMLGLLVCPFMLTGVLWHQVHLMDAKSWDRTVFPASLPLFAVAGAAFSFLSGSIIDKIGAPKTLAPALLLVAGGLFTLGLAEHPTFAPLAIFLLGGAVGATGTINGAIWPELYGTQHLGAIRAVAFAGFTFSTSLSPGLMGWLIDQNVSIDVQLMVGAAYTFGVMLILLLTVRHLKAKSPEESIETLTPVSAASTEPASK
ncbi:MAG: MFS transporter [Stappiaceae bacterium]